MLSVPRLLASPDKFRGTLGGQAVAAALAAGARAAGWEADEVAVSDGGEGFLDCFSGRGRVRTTSVQDALGRPVAAAIQVARRPVRAGFRVEISPPAPRLATRSPSSPSR